MHGTLEWPHALSAEPFVIVRGDEGRVYYVDISAAQRRGPGALTGGARIALLGIEGTRAREITALAIGAGDAVALVRAITSGLASASSTDAPPTAAPTPQVAVPSQPGAAAAPIAAPPQPTAPAVAAAAPLQPTPPAASMTAPSPASASPATSVSQRAAAAAPRRSRAPSAEPVAPVAAPPPAMAMAPSPNLSSPAAATPSVAALPSPVGEGRRWIEVRGVVQSVSGRTLVIHSDDGNVFAADVSELNANLTDTIKPGTTVSVFGEPLERRLRARGVMYEEQSPVRPKRAAGEAARKPSR
jgi:hypothetical protein